MKPADPEDNPKSMKTWRKVQPSWGQIADSKYYKDLVKRWDEGDETFKRVFLNRVLCQHRA